MRKQWENSLRDEAQKRLGVFQPPPLLGTSLLAAEDWALLSRVGGSSASRGAQAGAVSQLGGPMKRSASVNSLTEGGHGALSASQHGSNHHKLSRQWAWDEGSVQQAAMGYNFQNEANLFGKRHFGGVLKAPCLKEEEGEEQGKGQEGMVSATGKRDGPADEAQHQLALPPQPQRRRWSLGSPDKASSASSAAKTKRSKASLGLQRSYASSQQLSTASDVSNMPPDSMSSPSSPTSGIKQPLQQEQQQQQQQQLGLPRVTTAPLLQELGESINSQAVRNLEAMKLAIQNAQLSMQQTASNCQQNLQALSNMLQHNLQVRQGET